MEKFWSEDRIRLSKEILTKHSCSSCALKEMSGIFGKTITYDSLRNALRREDFDQRRLTDLLLSEGQCSCQSCLLDAVEKTEIHEQTKEKDSKIEQFEQLSKILARRHRDKKPITFGELCDKFDLSPKRMKEFLLSAKDFGYKLSIDNETVSFSSIDSNQVGNSEICIPIEQEHISFGVISDTHFGATASRHDVLKDFIDYTYSRGIRNIIHTGDITAGIGVYQGQVAELSIWGCDAQCENAKENLPQLPGLTYYAITGNHDVDFIKKAGVDVGQKIAKDRPDFVYLGALNKRLIINTSVGKIDIGLAHIKSSAHARSWPLEKHIQRTITKFDQPDMVFCGHRHVNGYFEVQGIHCFMVPCFEDANLFVHYNDFSPSIGGIIVDVYLDERGRIVRCVPEFKLYPINSAGEKRTTVLF